MGLGGGGEENFVYINMAKQDVPNKQKATGDINTNHSPPSAIASPSWCVQRPPRLLSSATPETARVERGGCIPTTAPKCTLFLIGCSPPPTHPPRWPGIKRETVTSRPGRLPLQPFSRTPNAGFRLAKLSKSFSLVFPSRSPRDRAFPLAGHPLTGGQRRQAGRGRPGAAEGRGGRSQVPGGPSAAPDRSPGRRKRKRKRQRGSFPYPPLLSATYTPPNPGLPAGGAGRRAAR